MTRTWNPWAELEDMQRRLNRAVSSADTTWAPATDIVESADGVELIIDLPDVDESSLEVTSEQNRLSVKANRRARPTEGRTVRYGGRPQGRFSRAFTVPSSFDLGQVTAAYENGVLTLSVPRSASAQPRKIDVSTGRTALADTTGQDTVHNGAQGDERVAEYA